MTRTSLFRSPTLLVLIALSSELALSATAARAAGRCSIALQRNVCLEANPVCPAAPPQLGLAPGSWPVFQGNVQHTGVSPLRGPTCGEIIWSRS